MANPLRVTFWMLGQDVRLGLLSQGGFSHAGPALYRRGSLWLHQLGLSLEKEGLLYLRADGRFYRVPPGTVPPSLPATASPIPFRQGWAELRPHLVEYEEWLHRHRPSYRQRLLRICPPALRPLRRRWREEFLAS